jgi:aryl-alcohol dehydrogenase-like predicted oxidoreductase
MQAVRLDKTGLRVSRVGLGGIPLTRPSEKEAVRSIRRALALKEWTRALIEEERRNRQ